MKQCGRPAWLGAGPRCLLGLLCLLGLGCSGRPAVTPQAASAAPASPAATKGMREQLLSGMVAILSELDRYDDVRGAEQVFDRLVQWSHTARAADWQPDALVATLPESLREAAASVLERPTFDGGPDVQAVRDRIWLAAIVRTAGVGGGMDEVEAATRLFHWTIRWLAAVSDPPMVPSETVPGTRWFTPGEILLAGRGSPAQRAWVFLELLRQAGIDGVMLATRGPAGSPPRPWVPAAIIGGEAYLFEPTYGMPIAGPGGVGVATVRQAAADPAILAALSLPDRPYPVQSGDLEDLVVLVPADAWSLSPRMARLDADLGPAHGVRVAVDATPLATRAKAAIQGTRGDPHLWTFPWETLARRGSAYAALAEELGPLSVPLPSADPRQPGQAVRPLFAGRVREFRGELEGPAGAKAAYLAARPSRRAIAQAVAGLPEEQATAATRGLARMKEDATYWLGLLTLSEGQFETAADYLGRMILEAAPDSRWTDAARVRLAAALVGLERPGEAAAALEADGSPQRFGSRLEAARLRAAVKSAESLSPEADDGGF